MSASKFCILMYAVTLLGLMCFFGILYVPNKPFAITLTAMAWIAVVMLGIDGCINPRRGKEKG